MKRDSKAKMGLEHDEVVTALAVKYGNRIIRVVKITSIGFNVYSMGNEKKQPEESI